MTTGSLPEDPADRDAIRARALKLLARREHARRELAQKLERRGYEAHAVAAVLTALDDEGVLSETRFAESVARSRAERGYGPLKIRAELSAKGVAEGVADTALAALDVDWPALAASVRCKRFGEAVPRDFPARAKQMRFLQQRGFSSEQIQRAVNES